jgi:uncharacterized protein YabN with tetrapyrrole methylase and pyrophosphatase domain
LTPSAVMMVGTAGSLVVVGSGIQLIRHTTLETITQIKRADIVFFAVNDSATQRWIQQLNANSETLADCYAEGKPRHETYDEMAGRILAAVRTGHHVCAVFYGHPGIVVDASHAAIRRAREEGFSARMLPGVSTNDCLFADLGVDPGDTGCQSFEATNFLLRRRVFDPTSALILWQVGVLGEPSVRKGMSCRPERLERLTAVLRGRYPARHPVVLYEAALFPICDPVIRRVRLCELPDQTVWPVTTLYVPPRPQRRAARTVIDWLDDDKPMGRPKTGTTGRRSAVARAASSSRSRRRPA